MIYDMFDKCHKILDKAIFFWYYKIIMEAITLAMIFTHFINGEIFKFCDKDTDPEQTTFSIQSW